jgi:2-C-methyl-D-erythritol 2,4-cyclodiphosphate synthase
MKYRIGFGYDVHAFAENRKLFIGGVEIPFEKGLKGHSDADVLLHAISDAILGALALGDIGQHFPDTDPQYENIDSKILMKKIYDLISEKGWIISNIDSTVVMERPKLKMYVPAIQNQISSILKIDLNQISIKATTSEKLGFVGLEEGVKAYAVVLLIKDDKD